MAFDLGLEKKSFSDDEEILDFIDELDKTVDFVMIADYFDESLILLKRMLCWDMEDIVYVKHKVRNPIFKNNITDKQKKTIREWNKADVMLYDHYNQTLWDKIKQQGTDFFEEVKELKRKVTDMNYACFEQVHSEKSFQLPMKLKKIIPQELKDICNKLSLKEKDYILLLKEKQKNRISEINKRTINSKFLRDLNDSKVYFEFENSSLAIKNSSRELA